MNIDTKIVYEEKPEDFNSSLRVVTSYLDYQNEFLILRYSGVKNKFWTAPGGKVEAGEATIDAFHRELREETGIVLDEMGKATPLKVLYFQYGDVSYECHPFYVQFSAKPEIVLSAEHAEYTWASLNEVVQDYDLITGAKQAISIHFTNVGNYGS